MVTKEERKSDSGQEVTEMVMAALRRIIRSIDMHSRFLVSNYGLTGPQLAVLRQLSPAEGMSVGRLTRAIHLSQATVTGILDRLEKRHMVQRRRSDRDKRCVLVELTPGAQQILSLAPPPIHENFTLEFGKLEDWQQTQILSSLQRVVSMLEAEHLDATPILTAGLTDAGPEETEVFLGHSPKAASGCPSGDGQGLASAAEAPATGETAPLPESQKHR